MANRHPVHAILTIMLLAGVCVPGGRTAYAQQSGSSGQTPPAQNQSGTDSSKPPADDNAFPVEQSEKAAKQAQQEKKDAAQPPSAPAADDPQQGSPDGSGGDTNAFPEDASRKAASEKTKAAAEGSSSSASGVSSSGDYDDRTNDRRVITPNVSMKNIHGKDLLKEDVSVGSYYLQSGDFSGAYARFKEATALYPENTDAMFGLAEAARHLNKNDEALLNYRLFLEIVPSGSKAKDARKALSTLAKAH